MLTLIMAAALLYALLAAGIGFGKITIGFALVLAIAITAAPIIWLRRHGHGTRQAAAAGEHPHTQPPALGVPVIDGLPDPLLILNGKREVVLANRAARQLFGRTVTGRDVTFTLRQPPVLSLVDKALASAAAGEAEVTLLAPVSRDFHVLVAPLHGTPPSAEQPAVALSLHEITEIRRAESMRADFVANASHELKTPLANLVGFIETLKGPARDDEPARDRFLDIMQTEASRMSRLINDLLSLSRIEQDEHMQPSTPVDTRALLEGVARLMQLRAEKQGITMELDLPDELKPIRGDQDQLIQVFQNLVDNALKYSPGGSIHIRARPVDRLPQGGSAGILISIEDHGEGIPKQHLPRLTERFYRVDAGRSRRMDGTGLGLAIVKHITRRHRGWLDIQSEAGKGTTVTVGLPLYTEAG
jgi:two-component system phosphate regulon sensor histidine kinase PhoR